MQCVGEMRLGEAVTVYACHDVGERPIFKK